MKHNKTYLYLLCGVFFASCSATRHLPEGEYILSHVKVERTDQSPQNEQLPKKDLERFIHQQPADRMLWTTLPEWIYNQANPEKDNWGNNFLRRIGSAPTILDSMHTSISANNMQLYAHSRGYFNATAKYEVKYDIKRQRADVLYSFYQGQPYLIDTISYEFHDSILAHVIPGSEADLRIKLDEPLDIVALNDERIRITDWLQERGYYGFTIDRITFRADTTLGNKRAALTMVVGQSEGEDANGETITENNPLYKIGDIYMMPDYDPVAAIVNPAYMTGMDTIRYNGINIVSHGTPSIRNSLLRRSITINSDELYSRSEMQRIYEDLTRMGYYRSASVNYNEAPDDGEDYYISPTDSTARTRIHRLTAVIQATPATRYNLTASLEATVNSTYYGIKPTIGYQNRNLFHGAEVLSVNLTGGWEYFFNNTINNNNNSYEVGIATSLAIPRFVAPFNIDPKLRIINPRSRFELSANYQKRPFYRRAIFNAAWGYTWNYKQISYIFRPISISYINVTDLDIGFLMSIVNPYLQNSYMPQMLVGMSAGAIYQSKSGNVTVGLNVESSGNVIYGLKALTGTLADSTVFGVPYAQYVRGEMSYTQRIKLGGDDFKLVYRLLGGIGYAYGNSSKSTLPMDRLFYSGGANSMRGWAIRTLGPGATQEFYNTFALQLGNMRLEANLELRYPIWGIMKGALFLDAGNIWNVGIGEYNEGEMFNLKTFYNQLGINTGIGFRFDLKYVVFRIDYGIRLFDPNQAETGSNWRFSLKNDNTAIQLGIGYPF